VLSEISLDRLVGGRLGLVNVTRRFLLEDYALLLPAGRVGLEVLEDVEASPELVAKLRELAARGYLVALETKDEGETWTEIWRILEMADG